MDESATAPEWQQIPADKAPGEADSELRLPERADPLPSDQRGASRGSPPSRQLLATAAVSPASPRTTKTVTDQQQYRASSQETKGTLGWSPHRGQARPRTAAASCLLHCCRGLRGLSAHSPRGIWQVSQLGSRKGEVGAE